MGYNLEIVRARRGFGELKSNEWGRTEVVRRLVLQSEII